MFKKTYGEGSGVGLNVGKVMVGDVTIGSMKTEDGKLWSFAAEGKLTDDPIEQGFFGCGTVFENDNGSSDDLLNYMSTKGYRHHVGIVRGKWRSAVKEAFANYLEYNIDLI